MKNFSVSYEIITPESAEDGDFESGGMLDENLSLREAMDYVGGYCEADSFPISLKNPPRWFSFYEINQNYVTGAVENRSLHLPRNITPSSAMRIARLLGVKGIK